MTHLPLLKITVGPALVLEVQANPNPLRGGVGWPVQYHTCVIEQNGVVCVSHVLYVSTWGVGGCGAWHLWSAAKIVSSTLPWHFGSAVWPSTASIYPPTHTTAALIQGTWATS